MWMVRVRLWIYTYHKTKRLCERQTALKLHASYSNQIDRNKILKLVNTVSRFVPKATCLTKALVAHTILKQFDFESRLFVGIKKNDDSSFEAHAWLQDDRSIIFGGDFSASFKPILVEK